MSYNNGPKSITDGLVLCLDAANSKSYIGSGTSWSDLSGNNNNGTLTNGPTYTSSFGGGIVFDGTNDYITIPNASGVNIGTVNHTENVWIKTSTTANQRITFKRYGGLGYGYSLNISNGTFAYEILTPSNYIVITGPSVTANTWYNVCVSIDRSGAGRMYVNGTQAATADYSSFVGLDITNTYQLTLGAVESSFGGGAYFNGTIASVCVYNKNLSASEVLQNYNANKGRFGL
jgi:hypothetical protein